MMNINNHRIFLLVLAVIGILTLSAGDRFHAFAGGTTQRNNQKQSQKAQHNQDAATRVHQVRPTVRSDEPVSSNSTDAKSLKQSFQGANKRTAVAVQAASKENKIPRKVSFKDRSPKLQSNHYWRADHFGLSGTKWNSSTEAAMKKKIVQHIHDKNTKATTGTYGRNKESVNHFYNRKTNFYVAVKKNGIFHTAHELSPDQVRGLQEHSHVY